jgi:hypothetical protein
VAGHMVRWTTVTVTCGGDFRLKFGVDEFGHIHRFHAFGRDDTVSAAIDHNPSG